MAQRSKQEVAQLHERLSERMQEQGLRSTNQRRSVCDAFFRSKGHHSVDELLRIVNRRDPTICYATVYRTLRMLVETGLANERHFGDAYTRFEVTHPDGHHDHLICLSCDSIVEFEDEEIERLQELLAKRHGYRLVRHRHELYGVCRKCRRRGVGTS